MITFNAGGLSAAAYDELMIWLHQPQCARYSIVVIEETWWKQDSMYSDQNWNFVHSAGSTGTQGKNTGILVMIRKSFVPEGCIKHRVVVPGRVLHVRLEQQKNFHLVCVYQHAWSHQIAQETMLARRDKVWEAIRRHVHFQMRGSLNKPTGNIKADDPLEWCFAWAERRLKALPDENLELLRKNLADGILLLTRFSGLDAPTLVKTSFDFAQLREAVGAGSAQAVAFGEDVRRSLVGAQIDTPQALNEHVLPILARHFPKAPGQARARPWQHHALQARYPRLWQLRRALGVGPPPGLHRLSGHVLRYWRLLVIYQREAREAKRASRALRKQYLRDELRQAENAYQRGDQKGLFEVMRRLAPKQRKAKVQLRGEDGRILSNAEELRVFTEYCQGLFSQALAPVLVHFADKDTGGKIIA
ncbi:hypothetical protein AK812_SmicGene6435, partial [Symbiodinium microadriaticum]